MIVVDTSILVYAVGADHQLRAPCRHLVQLVADGTVERHPTLGAFDAVLAATARRVGDGILASTDGAFRSVDSLRLLDPAEEAFATFLLGPEN